MKKTDREFIFNKYQGKCAYCGCALTKGWHVDEIEPVRRYTVRIRNENGAYLTKIFMEHPENLHIDNQMPACASCNINKHSGSLENFRSLIEGFISSLNKYSVQYKIAKRYGLIKEVEKPIVFYFEQV